MNSIEEIIKKIAVPGTENYECYSILRDTLKNEEFYNIVKTGIETKQITGFSEKLWNGLAPVYTGCNLNLYELFEKGENAGGCTTFSILVSYSLSSCIICGGVNKYLVGTYKCEDGSHTWIDNYGTVIDTSLMLQINRDYLDKMGYHEENRYNPNFDHMYCIGKEMATDTRLKHS